MKSLKLQNGITLIALVITIIVLLILAGVSVSMVMGENGIAIKAKEAKKETEEAKKNEEEYLKQLEDEIEKFDEVEKKIDFEKIKMEVLEEKEIYLGLAQELGQDGDNYDIGIGTDGNVVNLDLWTYTEIEEAYISLDPMDANSDNNSSYENSNIEDDGTIIGTMPQYIYLYELDDILPVININRAFKDCTDLKVAPELPSTITYMNETFMSCINLKIAPIIPKEVTGLYSTFLYCDKLEKCVIPSNIMDIGQNTFIKNDSNNKMHLYFEHIDDLPSFSYMLADGRVYNWCNYQSNIVAYFKNTELADFFANEFYNIEVSENYKW